LNYRESERFPTCSSFKVLAAGALLVRVDAGREAEMTPAICSLWRRSGAAQMHLKHGTKSGHYQTKLAYRDF
jgi:hypothetical protein